MAQAGFSIRAWTSVNTGQAFRAGQARTPGYAKSGLA